MIPSYHHLAILKHQHHNNKYNVDNNNNYNNNVKNTVSATHTQERSISSPHSNRSGIQYHQLSKILFFKQSISVQSFQSSKDYSVWYLTQSQNNCHLTKCSLLSLPPFPPCLFLTEGSPYHNLRANPCFLLLGSDPSIVELEFWLAAHWTHDLFQTNFIKSSRFQKN